MDRMYQIRTVGTGMETRYHVVLRDLDGEQVDELVAGPYRYWGDARAEAQRLNRSADATGQPRPKVRTMSREALEAEGWVAVQGPTPDMKVGDEAVVYARGDLRLGTINKIGRNTVYVSVATPTSPDLVTNGRIGGRWNERGYIRPADPICVVCGGPWPTDAPYTSEPYEHRCHS